MKKSTFKNIGQRVAHRQKITLSDIIKERERLCQGIRLPEFWPSRPLRVKTQTALFLTVNDFRLPVIDLFNGRMKYVSPLHAEPPVVMSFPGPAGPVFVPASYLPKRKGIVCTVPINAIDGELAVLIPVCEIFGDRQQLQQLADTMKIDVSRASQSDYQTDICPPLSPDPAHPLSLDRYIRWRWSVAAKAHTLHKYVRVVVGPISVGCTTCHVGCPHGAITLNEHGVCTVDPEVCEGQKFKIDRDSRELTSDGREVYQRLSEQSCWTCFAATEQVSQKCPRRILRKALHHNGVCCASCSTFARVDGPTLMDLCTHGAISIDEGGYLVDKDACVGCMTCYYGINCANNVEAGEPLCCSGGCPANTDGNDTIRMVAYSDHTP